MNQIESGLTSTGPANEPQIVEFGHVILDDSGGVAQLGAPVLVVAGADGDQSAVLDAAEAHDAECGRQRLVGPPVGGQRRADDTRATCAHQFTSEQRRWRRRVADDFSQRPVGPQQVGARRRIGRR